MQKENEDSEGRRASEASRALSSDTHCKSVRLPK